MSRARRSESACLTAPPSSRLQSAFQRTRSSLPTVHPVKAKFAIRSDRSVLDRRYLNDNGWVLDTPGRIGPEGDGLDSAFDGALDHFQESDGSLGSCSSSGSIKYTRLRYGSTSECALARNSAVSSLLFRISATSIDHIEGRGSPRATARRHKADSSLRPIDHHQREQQRQVNHRGLQHVPGAQLHSGAKGVSFIVHMRRLNHSIAKPSTSAPAK